MTGLKGCKQGLLLRQRGTAAVEMALLTIVMAGLLLSPIMVAHSLMQVTLAQRAAFNAAHMLATYPQYQRLDTAGDPTVEATALLSQALAEGGLGGASGIDPFCTNSYHCQKPAVPTDIAISLSINVLNPTLADFSTLEIQLGAYDRYSN